MVIFDNSLDKGAVIEILWLVSVLNLFDKGFDEALESEGELLVGCSFALCSPIGFQFFERHSVSDSHNSLLESLSPRRVDELFSELDELFELIIEFLPVFVEDLNPILMG